MAVGGLVLSLSAEAPQRLAAERWIRSDPRLEEGPREGLRLAVVALTDTVGGGHDLCQELLAHPGIDHLEVAYVAPEEEATKLQGTSPSDMNRPDTGQSDRHRSDERGPNRMQGDE